MDKCSPSLSPQHAEFLTVYRGRGENRILEESCLSNCFIALSSLKRILVPGVTEIKEAKFRDNYSKLRSRDLDISAVAAIRDANDSNTETFPEGEIPRTGFSLARKNIRRVIHHAAQCNGQLVLSVANLMTRAIMTVASQQEAVSVSVMNATVRIHFRDDDHVMLTWTWKSCHSRSKLLSMSLKSHVTEIDHVREAQRSSTPPGEAVPSNAVF